MIFRCNASGCGKRITKDDKGRCSEHKRRYQSYRKNKAQQYGHQWRKTRKAFLERYPICARCAMIAGQVIPADVVDHMEYLTDNSDHTQIHCFDNLAPLCHSCHSLKTVHIDGLWGSEHKSLVTGLDDFKELISDYKARMDNGSLWEALNETM